MKPKIIFKKDTGKPRSSPLKVLNSTKTHGVTEVRVRILPKCSSVKNLSSASLISPASVDRSIGFSSTSSQGFITQNKNTHKLPDDFIEPVEDLTIPSTAQYEMYTKHHPTKSMNDDFTKISVKPPRPEKSLNRQKVLERNTVINRILGTKYKEIKGKTTR